MTKQQTPPQPAGGTPVERPVRPNAPAAVVGMTAAGVHIGGAVGGKVLPWTSVEAAPTALLMRPLPVGSVLYDQSDLDAAVAAERERIAQHFDARDMGKDGKPRGIGFYDPHEPAEIIRALGPNDGTKGPAARPVPLE